MTTHRNTIGVIGAGRWGTTLAQIATKHERDVLLWTGDDTLAGQLSESRAHPALPELEQLSERVDVTTDLARVADTCHLILLANPAEDVRSVARSLGAHIDGSHCVVHALRGLEPTTLKTPSQVVEQETCAIKVGAFIGPARVRDLLAGTPNAAVVASVFPEVIRETQAALACNVLRVYSNRDLLGVESAAAAASVVAFSLGVCLELKLGPAAIALLTTRGVAEISRIVAALGGEARTAFGLSGLGDVLVSRESGGRDVEAGRLFTQGKDLKAILDTIGPFDAHAAAHTLAELGESKGIDVNITAFVRDALFGDLSIGEGIQRLMNVRQMEE